MRRLLVPSPDFDRLAYSGARGGLRIAASLAPETRDHWRPYRMTRQELPAALLALLPND